MIRVGLTGNIGCGKSTIARRLAERGAAVVDADALVHAALAEGGEAVAAVLALVPQAAQDGGGSVDRRALARIVFADAALRRALEGILHPIVWRRQRVLAEAAQAAGAHVFVVEASQLFEAWRAGGPDPRERFDVLVVATCDEELQVARVLARGQGSGTSEAERERDVRARIAAQMPQAEKAALADEVIDTSGCVAETHAAADLLFSRLSPET